MAGRNRIPRHPADFQGFGDDLRPMLNRGPRPLRVHPAALEEEIDFQHRENQKIMTDNRHLIDENMVLERDLVAAKEEVRRLDQVIAKLHADHDAQTRGLINRGLKLEADLHTIEPLRQEVVRLRAESQKLNALRQDLTVQIQGLTREITRLRSDNKQLSTMRADVDAIRKELAETRRALEYEKKANEEQVQQKQAIEKNLMSIVHEIEKLQAQKLRMDRRVHSHGGTAGNYGLYDGNPDMRYAAGGPYGDRPGLGRTWDSYDRQGPSRR